MNAAASKFTVRIAPVLPGDFGPSGFAVYPKGSYHSKVVVDGDVVEAIGPIEVSVEHEYTDEGRETIEIAQRLVRLPCGFEGMVCWTDFNGRSGFQPV